MGPYSSYLGFCVGDRVLCGVGKLGICRFIGETHFAPGIWAGVDLTQGVGKNDGSVQGIRYFQCECPHGLFVLACKVVKAPATPTVTRNRLSMRPNKSFLSRHDRLPWASSQESLSSFGSSGINSMRSTPRIDRRSMGNVVMSNPYEKTIRTLEESLEEIQGHLENVLREREVDQVEIARLTAEVEGGPRVKALEAEVEQLTNELLEKSNKMEELTFTLEEERIVAHERLTELELELAELRKNDDSCSDTTFDSCSDDTFS
ncbi:hypothetical protein QR680_014445 [Steinernema hermaphroditum]|uniref:CAP-Gly domain-containing protein n=1 Tax=Steinernema hermaphroditum TaxID=289476 RepID=A0AA39M3X5_9BILA|nr:hypothetical protein QR680_014445 [Steinernema hermaphroditum]